MKLISSGGTLYICRSSSRKVQTTTNTIYHYLLYKMSNRKKAVSVSIPEAVDSISSLQSLSNSSLDTIMNRDEENKQNVKEKEKELKKAKEIEENGAMRGLLLSLP